MKQLKPIYAFEEADSKNRMLLGGKGAGLSEMTRLKLPVPSGFTITTEVCNQYYENGKKLPKNLIVEVRKNIIKIEGKTGKNGIHQQTLYLYQLDLVQQYQCLA